eukprot:TRINITY_DN9427_c0_g1_i1.p1 TRINITY_DN9427_c0_g1~~TRINITY_DN9427_c0_g1_i1.p1  ORF type:complete len:293 (+),score=66.54 TRINITY_DN9427_c0_g1_i1:69-881(+)
MCAKMPPSAVGSPEWLCGVEHRLHEKLSGDSLQLRGLQPTPPERPEGTPLLCALTHGRALADRKPSAAALAAAAVNHGALAAPPEPPPSSVNKYAAAAARLPMLFPAAIGEWFLDATAPPQDAASRALHAELLEAVRLAQPLPSRSDISPEAAAAWDTLPRRPHALARAMSIVRADRSFLRWRRGAALLALRKRQRSCAAQLSQQSGRLLRAARYWALLAYACRNGRLPVSALRRAPVPAPLARLARLVRATRECSCEGRLIRRLAAAAG